MKYRNGGRRAPGEVKYGLLEGKMRAKCVGEKVFGPLRTEEARGDVNGRDLNSLVVEWRLTRKGRTGMIL